MSVTGTIGSRLPAAQPAAARPRGAVWSAYRVERRKLTVQLVVRVLALVCLVGPFAFAAVLSAQGGAPTDALLGVWVHSSGFAVPLVVLGFAGSWGFPLLFGILAGDLFSSEDRHGTWKTVLTRSCDRGEMFLGKLLAAAQFTVGFVVLTAASSLVAGLVFVGDQPLVGLNGVLLSPGECLGLVVASWLYCALPALAFTSLAVLFSVTTRSGIIGAIGPAVVALVTQLLDLIGRGVWVHMLLIGSAFDGWHGLFTSPTFKGPLLVSAAVSLAWIAVCLGVSWLTLRRRDFAGAPDGRRAGWLRSVSVVAAAVVLIALLAMAGNLGPVGVTGKRLRTTLTAEFERLTFLQQRTLGRSVPQGAKLNILSSCTHRGSTPEGPGDWICTLNVFIPQPGAEPFQQTPVTYDVSAQSNGCFKAASPPSFVGQQTMRDARGRSVVNPLFVIYGCFDPL